MPRRTLQTNPRGCGNHARGLHSRAAMSHLATLAVRRRGSRLFSSAGFASVDRHSSPPDRHFGWILESVEEGYYLTLPSAMSRARSSGVIGRSHFSQFVGRSSPLKNVLCPQFEHSMNFRSSSFIVQSLVTRTDRLQSTPSAPEDGSR